MRYDISVRINLYQITQKCFHKMPVLYSWMKEMIKMFIFVQLIIFVCSTLIRTLILITFRSTARESSHLSFDLSSISILFAIYESCYFLLYLQIENFNLISFIGLGPFIRLTCLPCFSPKRFSVFRGNVDYEFLVVNAPYKYIGLTRIRF